MYKANIFKSIDSQDKPLALAVRIYEDASMTTMAEIKTPSGDTTTTIQWIMLMRGISFIITVTHCFKMRGLLRLKRCFMMMLKISNRNQNQH